MSYFVRRAKPGDGAGIIRAHVRSIREVCAKDYTPEQVEAWAGRDFSVEHREASTLRDQVWVVEGPGGEIFGFGHSGGDAEKGFYLYGLYFCPEVRGMGFGKQIVGEILDVVRAEGAKKISLHATRTALAFYEGRGFRKIPGPEFLLMQGVELPCFPMAMDL